MKALVSFSASAISFSVILFFAFTASVASAQYNNPGPATESSVNRGQSQRTPQQHHHQNHPTRWVDRSTPPPPQNTCYEDRQEWVPGSWQFSYGRRIWVAGRWVVNRVAVPCPYVPPPPPPPPVNYSGQCQYTTLSPQFFSQAMESIRSRGFESSRMIVAKQVITGNCLTSAQVRDILLLFDFESNRLELAKYAFGYTVDKNAYFTVNDAFRFESSVRELNAFIQSCPR